MAFEKRPYDEFVRNMRYRYRLEFRIRKERRKLRIGLFRGFQLVGTYKDFQFRETFSGELEKRFQSGANFFAFTQISRQIDELAGIFRYPFR